MSVFSFNLSDFSKCKCNIKLLNTLLQFTERVHSSSFHKTLAFVSAERERILPSDLETLPNTFVVLLSFSSVPFRTDIIIERILLGRQERPERRRPPGGPSFSGLRWEFYLPCASNFCRSLQFFRKSWVIFWLYRYRFLQVDFHVAACLIFTKISTEISIFR